MNRGLCFVGISGFSVSDPDQTKPGNVQIYSSKYYFLIIHIWNCDGIVYVNPKGLAGLTTTLGSLE